MFHIGQEVVCIRDKDTWFDITGNYPLHKHFPQLNEICVVTGAINVEGETYLFLRGLGSLHSWAAEAFRPLTKTDISVFKKLLRPTKKKRKVLGDVEASVIAGILNRIPNVTRAEIVAIIKSTPELIAFYRLRCRPANYLMYR